MAPASSPAERSSTTLSGLVNNNQYSIRVQAHNGAGWGPYGPAVVKQSVGTPAAVAAPRLAPKTANPGDSNGLVTISWNTTDPNGPAITTYTVYRRVGGGGWATVGSVSGSASRVATDTMPYDGRTYEYTVTATNGGGKESPKTNTASYRATGIPVVPGAPKVVESGFDYLAKVTVTLGDSRASSYTSVKWRSSSGENGSWACGGCADGATRTFTTTKLPTTVQNISVSACNDATPVACSGWSGGASGAPVRPHPGGHRSVLLDQRQRRQLHDHLEVEQRRERPARTTRSGSPAPSTATSAARPRASRSVVSATRRRSRSPWSRS